MSLAQDDDMIEAFTANRTNEPLDVGILPRGVGRDRNFFDAALFDALAKHAAVDAVVVADQIFRRGIEWKRLHDLLRSPVCGRMGRDIEVEYATTIRGQHHESIQQAERGRGYDKEIDRRDLG